MKRRMKVELPGWLWDELRLDDELRYHTAICALYNGYGMLKLQSLMAKDMHCEECRSLRDTAEFLGICKEDKIVRMEN